MSIYISHESDCQQRRRHYPFLRLYPVDEDVIDYIDMTDGDGRAVEDDTSVQCNLSSKLRVGRTRSFEHFYLYMAHHENFGCKNWREKELSELTSLRLYELFCYVARELMEILELKNVPYPAAIMIVEYYVEDIQRQIHYSLGHRYHWSAILWLLRDILDKKCVGMKSINEKYGSVPLYAHSHQVHYETE